MSNVPIKVKSDKESLRDARFRKLKQPISMISKVLLGLVPIMGIIFALHVPERMGLLIYKEQYLGALLTCLLAATFLMLPATDKASKTTLPWYDIVLTILSFVAGGYISVFYPKVLPMLGYLRPTEIILGSIMIVLVLESMRRIIGLAIVITAVVFVLYGHFAYLLPGIFHANGLGWGRLITNLYISPIGILGTPLSTVGTVVFAFIFFGYFLFAVGGGQFLTNVAMSLTGRYRGGAAKVSVVGSGLVGTITGSTSSNIVLTGVVTIPMMKQSGYQPHVAGAVEAVASSGGVLMPPVMGAVAFIMAEFLAVPYAKIALAALLPAILYYTAVFIQVDLKAVKGGLKGIPPKELPSLIKELKKGWLFIIPLSVLIYCLFILYLSAETSALYATGAIILVSLFRKSTWIPLRRFASIIVMGGRGLMEVCSVCAGAGLIIGSVALTGLGVNLSRMLIAVAGGNVFILLLLAAVGAIILGMGMPLTATYIMLVILIAPSLIQMGIEPIAAHLFMIYFGAMSFVTPPVCIGAYVASSIAGSDPMKTGFAAVRLAIMAYIVPFIFAFSPSLLLMGPVDRIVLSFVCAAIGTILVAIGIEGYLFRKLNILKRIIFIAVAVSLFVPFPISNFVGLALAVPLLIWEWLARRALMASKATQAP